MYRYNVIGSLSFRQNVRFSNFYCKSTHFLENKVGNLHPQSFLLTSRCLASNNGEKNKKSIKKKFPPLTIDSKEKVSLECNYLKIITYQYN